MYIPIADILLFLLLCHFTKLQLLWIFPFSSFITALLPYILHTIPTLSTSTRNGVILVEQFQNHNKWYKFLHLLFSLILFRTPYSRPSRYHFNWVRVQYKHLWFWVWVLFIVSFDYFECKRAQHVVLGGFFKLLDRHKAKFNVPVLDDDLQLREIIISYETSSNCVYT